MKPVSAGYASGTRDFISNAIAGRLVDAFVSAVGEPHPDSLVAHGKRILGGRKAESATKRRSRSKASVNETKQKKVGRKAPKKKRCKPVKDVCKEIQKIREKVKELDRENESGMGTKIYRSRHSSQLIAAVGLQRVTSGRLFGKTDLESTITSLKYFDPAVPGTLVTANGNTPTFQNEFYFKHVDVYIEVTNNYQVPVYVDLFIMKPKTDTGITPSGAFTNGLSDIGAPSSTSPMVRLHDSIQLKDLWSTSISKRGVLLKPGQSLRLSDTMGGFQFDPSLLDSHAYEYMPMFHGRAFAIRFWGQVGHDTVVAEVGNLGCGVDTEFGFQSIVKYAAGTDVHDLQIADNFDASFTTAPNLGVCSQMPLADNQSYSIA